VGGKGTLGGLIKDEPADASIRQASRDLQAALANLKEITAKVNEGEGTLGALIADPTVYERLVSSSTARSGASCSAACSRASAAAASRKRASESARDLRLPLSGVRLRQPQAGTCPDCLRGAGAYVQLVEERSEAPARGRRPGAVSPGRPQSLKDVVLEAGDRLPTGIR